VDGIGPSCLVVGAVCTDVISTGGRTRKAIGGTAFYFSAAFSALGGYAGCVCKVDEDWMIREMERSQVPLEGVRSGACAVYSLDYRREDRNLRLMRRSDRILPSDVPPEFWGLEAAHIGPVEAEIDPQIFSAARKRFELCTLDVQGLARSFGMDGRVGLKIHMDGELYAAVSSVDIVKFGEEEALSLLGAPEQWSARARNLIELGPRIVIVTLGERGSLLLTSEERHRVPAYRCRVVDPTGAGDCYMAGLVYRVLKGDEPVQAARFGSALASLVVERERPLTFPREDEVLERMESAGGEISNAQTGRRDRSA